MNTQIQIILILFSFNLLLSCTQGEPIFSWNHESPQIDFAIGQIRESISGNTGFDANSIEFQFMFEEREEQNGGYTINPEGKNVTITADDVNGLMYGGLEVAEQIALYGEVEQTSHSPYILKRGIKMNIPLDARTPSYDDTGDAAQKNYEQMWSWDFWQEYLDNLAIHRYNVLTLWNPHPFPSMIKQENYPDVALNDVCVTTLNPTGAENEWAEPQMVSSNVVENLRVVKEMTMDEKITFWQKVMQYAQNRGIEIYFFTWNICPNGAASPVYPFYKTTRIDLEGETPGKHGITNQQENPVTVQYYRDAVKTFLLTYPHVKGIGVTAGEHMMNSAGSYTREQWIWEAYGLGILDAKKEQPDREVDFIHRVWNTDMDKINGFWKDYPDSFEASFKYARARLYSTPTPDFARGHIEAMKRYGLKSWWNLRNDDIFVHRWGDPDYVRDFINYLDMEHTSGFYMGSDGYVWGREFNSKHPELSGMLEIEKHWYRFMLWGRLAYNNELDVSFFQKKLATRYPGADAAKLYTGFKTASKIIPTVNCFHWNSWDYQWSVEACFDVRNGFHDIQRFMDNPTLEGSGILNPLSYAESAARDQLVEGRTPYQVASELDGYAESVMEIAEQLQNTQNTNELAALLDDMLSMAFLGMYYSAKIKAATELALYLETRKPDHKEKAVSLLHEAAEHFKAYGTILRKNYRPQRLARTGNFDCDEILVDVLKDIVLAKELIP